MRSLVLVATAALAVGLLPGSPLAPAPAVAGTTCAGLAVTIDLNQADHPDPKRAASDVVLGTEGDDDIEGGGGADVICGGAGNDLIEGGGGADVLYGEDGDDSIEWGLGFRGEDRAFGGPGDDGILGAGPGDRYFGGEGADVFFGAGCEYVSCAGGTIRFVGGVGDDVFRPGHIDDFVAGGPGVDLADYNDSGSPSPYRTGITVDIAITGWQDTGIGAMDRLLSIENLEGSNGPDRLFGNAGPNDIRGGPGKDRLRGRGGDDLLVGDLGIDFCRGGAGNDELVACDT